MSRSFLTTAKLYLPPQRWGAADFSDLFYQHPTLGIWGKYVVLEVINHMLCFALGCGSFRDFRIWNINARAKLTAFFVQNNCPSGSHECLMNVLADLLHVMWLYATVHTQPTPLEDVLPHASAEALSLLDAMLKWVACTSVGQAEGCSVSTVTKSRRAGLMPQTPSSPMGLWHESCHMTHCIVQWYAKLTLLPLLQEPSGYRRLGKSPQAIGDWARALRL